MSAIETLVDEHRLISRMVNVLTVLRKSLEKGEDADVNVLMDVVDFFRVFADQCHHAKEEDALFPSLERHAISIQGCTIESLKSDHKQARALMVTLAEGIRNYKSGDSTVRDDISATMGSAINLYKDHIWRENILLFPTSEKLLQESELNDIEKSYGVIETTLGIDFRAKYERLVGALEKAADID